MGLYNPPTQVQDEGSALPQQPAIDFQGAGVTAADGTGKTVVTIPGGGSASDASTTVKGIIKTSVAPASAANPIAVGDNDTRVQPQGRNVAAPFSENLTGTLAVPYVGAELRMVRGPLTGDVVLNSSGATSGARMVVLAVQGATPRAITIDGNAVTGLSQTNGALIRVDVAYVDVAGTVTPHIVATTLETDPLAILKSIGTTKGDTLAFSASATPVRVPVGADNTIRVADSAAAAGVSYKTLLATFAAVVTPTKGRLLVADGTNWGPLTVGSDTQVLTADSAQTLGVKWAAAGGGSGISPNARPIPFRAAQAYLLTGKPDGSNHTASNSFEYAHPFTCLRAGTLTEVGAQVNNTPTTGAQARLILRADNAGVPGNVLEQVVFTADTSGVKPATFTTALTLGATYWVSLINEGAPATAIVWKGGGDMWGTPVDTSNLSLGQAQKRDRGATSGAVANGVASDWSIHSDTFAIYVKMAT